MWLNLHQSFLRILRMRVDVSKLELCSIPSVTLSVRVQYLNLRKRHASEPKKEHLKSLVSSRKNVPLKRLSGAWIPVDLPEVYRNGQCASLEHWRLSSGCIADGVGLHRTPGDFCSQREQRLNVRSEPWRISCIPRTGSRELTHPSTHGKNCKVGIRWRWHKRPELWGAASKRA